MDSIIGYLILISKMTTVFLFMMFFMWAFVLFMAITVRKTTKKKKVKESLDQFFSAKTNVRKSRYVLPWTLFVLSPTVYILLILITFFICLFTPIFIYVELYGPLGPGNIVSTSLRFIKYPLILTIAFGTLSWYSSPRLKLLKTFKKLEAVPVKKWMVRNVVCPKCGKHFKSCEFDSFYSCYCSKCRKKYIFSSAGREIWYSDSKTRKK